MSDRKTLSVADLAKLNVAINVEKAVESQERVLQPRTSMYVALTGLSFSDVDENSGSQHLIVHVTPLDYAASLAKNAIVPLSKGEFTMGQFRVVMTPPIKIKDPKSGEWRAMTDAEAAEQTKKNSESTGSFFGAALRAAGVKDTPTTPNEVLTLVGKAIEEGRYPVGLFNASSNGPDLKDSYMDKKTNKVKEFPVKDYSEVSFSNTSPETVLKDLRATSTALESAGKAHDHDAIAAALRLPDVRQYAKVAAKSTRSGRSGNGNGGGGLGGGNEGGGFSGFGNAPSED